MHRDWKGAGDPLLRRVGVDKGGLCWYHYGGGTRAQRAEGSMENEGSGRDSENYSLPVLPQRSPGLLVGYSSAPSDEGLETEANACEYSSR